MSFPPSKKFMGKRHLLTAVKHKTYTRDQYINSVKRKRPNAKIKVVKKKRPKGYKYGIYVRLH